MHRGNQVVSLVSPTQEAQGRSKARLGRGDFKLQIPPGACGPKKARDKNWGQKNAPVREPFSNWRLGLARFMETGGSDGFPTGTPQIGRAHV